MLEGIIHPVRTNNFQKTNISYSLIRTRMCAYQGVRNVSFLKNCSFVLTGYSLRLDDLFKLLFFMYMFYGLLVVIPSFRSVIFLVFVVLFKIIVIKIYSLVCVKTTFSLSKTVIAIITSWIMESRLFSDIIDNFLCQKDVSIFENQPSKF